ncbi:MULTISPECIES: VOC family protein [unclassified Streptomyces]|uniref:VOC family protein n=1 Tax=unclassified Streptomyces TaxID=2593676 RepID=UPI0006F414E8|nr:MULTISPECIES: VOC family protein [unclassified Streptomyces]KQX49803.1 3-demethylubiquinone-9 3-methyltransferase [Streptomyces sp. Root1304]KRA80153.1 3-demethylubiquinone-9 3-methyltransferase [Streptomyces sp. Root66D1]
MASRLNPYISFTGDAKQALEFYKDVLGGDLTLNTYGSFGAETPPGYADKVMHGLLETSAGFTLMGADNPPGMTNTPGNNFAVSLSGDDAAELRGYWEKLSAGGAVSVPLEKQMWGDVFGMCTDKFGITWMVNISEQ